MPSSSFVSSEVDIEEVEEVEEVEVEVIVEAVEVVITEVVAKVEVVITALESHQRKVVLVVERCLPRPRREAQPRSPVERSLLIQKEAVRVARVAEVERVERAAAAKSPRKNLLVNSNTTVAVARKRRDENCHRLCRRQRGLFRRLFKMI